MKKAKDNRKVFQNKSIEVDGTVVRFSGKYNPDRDELKVYRYDGNINLIELAFQNFCIENRIGTCIIKL